MTTISRLRHRRPDPADGCPEALVTGTADLLLADVETSLERERERRVAVREQQARCLADALEELGGTDCLFLHRRQAPTRDCADIDLIAVTPTGVWVIGAWHEPGARVEVAFSGGALQAERERLMVRGKDKTQLVNCLAGQMESVRRALAAYDVPVRGLLYFRDAVLPTFWTSSIQGFALADTEVASKRLTADGPVDPEMRRLVRRALDEALPEV